MKRLDQKGDLLIPLIVSIVFLLGALIFGFWAFAGRQDYKNNSDAKVAEAVKDTEASLGAKKDAEFAEKYKLPNLTYRGPASFGTLTFDYPKTWSTYLSEAGTGNEPLNGFMHPVAVPAENDKINIALRFQVVNRSYEQELKTHEANITTGKTSMRVYKLPKVQSVLGARLNGTLAQKQGDMVILPLRDKTIKIWTEGSDYAADFSKILESLTFVP